MELEQWTLEQLVEEWYALNRKKFGLSIRIPTFQLHDGKSRLGFWERQHRVISLSREFVFTESWLKVVAVLQHEMLHQYLDEAMGAVNVPPHGELFKTMEQQLGLDTYEQVGLQAYQQEDGHPSAILDKVKKLLSLAQSDQVHEAESAMSKANALMLKWNLSQSDLRTKKNFEVRYLGQPSKIYLHLKMLSSLLRDFFFVDTIWVTAFCPKKGNTGRVLEVMGRPENIEMAEYVYHYLLNYGDQQWREHRKSTGGGKRMNFLYGLIRGFYEKCERGRDDLSQNAGLVWKGEPWLQEVMKKRHPRTRKTASSSAVLDEGSYLAGKSHGEKLVLRKGVHGKGQSGQIGQGVRGFLG